MDYTSLLMMAFVWSVLFLYFLMPFKRSAEMADQGKLTFLHAMKICLASITFHKKAFLALSLVVITLLIASWSQNQEALYNEIHGIVSTAEPFNCIMGIMIYAAVLYFLLIGGKALKLLRQDF
ncbi:hypothetical protein [Jeotgalibacillus proteolyticus]|uniref:Uncharacterized protein n=1 Tax=Jeotgalibacillus proteolyticus TaxID=2082395 RepID=A0A2S5G8Q9_9BACL|nr:hypothetical protein [Jeotgalibacillus proteolyticus]PPA69304.1 hypothetical protein C4B60_16020 [Jeotgalibacillus proteolyticus]